MFISCLASKLFTTYNILCLFNYPISICNKAVIYWSELDICKNLNKGSLHTKHFKLGLQYTELKCHTLNNTLLSRISRLYILSDGFYTIWRYFFPTFCVLTLFFSDVLCFDVRCFDIIFSDVLCFDVIFFRHSVFRCSVFWHYFFRRSLCFDV